MTSFIRHAAVGTKNSLDYEFIGCRISGHAGVGNQVQCGAQDATGIRVACTSTDAAIVATVQAISTYSWILFGFDNSANPPPSVPPDEDGDCDFLFVSTRSFHIPDTRDQNPGRKPN
jgi:hypothetical protein